LSAIIGVSVWSKGTQGVRLTGSIPPYSERAWMFGAHLLVNEILFFYAHWAMHKGSLYKMFHKKHHEFTAPFALAALYCHPVEFIVAGKIGKEHIVFLLTPCIYVLYAVSMLSLLLRFCCTAAASALLLLFKCCSVARKTRERGETAFPPHIPCVFQRCSY
jgi:sterol desaturase/sphingolipid hydroxylase (fatty acid hydroxylase superfamily)